MHDRKKGDGGEGRCWKGWKGKGERRGRLVTLRYAKKIDKDDWIDDYTIITALYSIKP